MTFTGGFMRPQTDGALQPQRWIGIIQPVRTAMVETREFRGRNQLKSGCPAKNRASVPSSSWGANVQVE